MTEDADTVEIDREVLTNLRGFADAHGDEYGTEELYRDVFRAGEALGVDDPEPHMAWRDYWNGDEPGNGERVRADGGDGVTDDELRQRISGEHLIHRLRDWNDGDTLYGAKTFNPDTGGGMGKTYREGDEYGEQDAEALARGMYSNGPTASGVSVLFRATVRNPRAEPRDPSDPGEPPLKYGTLTDVEILDWKQPGDGGTDG